MSTQLHEANATRTTSRRATFTVEDAPQVFSPHNTDPCPQMFANKWAVRGKQL